MKTLSLALLAVSLQAGSILNPGFEIDSGTGSSANWTDTDSLFGFTRCSAAVCGNGGGSAGPNTGTFWTWLGGEGSIGQTAVLEQSGITIPVATSGITFYLWIGAADAPFTLTFKVDGTTLLTLTEADAAAYAAYTLVSLNPGAFADGGDHTFRFDYSDAAATGGGQTHVNLDDISLKTSTAAPVPEPTTLVLSGVALIALGALRRRRRSA